MRIPSLGTLEKIASVLNVPLDYSLNKAKKRLLDSLDNIPPEVIEILSELLEYCKRKK